MRRLSLLIFLSACSTSTVAVSGTTAVTSPVVASPHGAFVVYFARETLVIPAFPEHAVASIPGMLIQDDSEGMGSAVSYLTVTNSIPRGASCPCRATPDACEVSITPLITRVTRGEGGLSVRLNDDPAESLASCACLVSDMDWGYDDAEESECGDPTEESDPLSFLGGALFVYVALGEPDCDEGLTREVELFYTVESAEYPDVDGIEGEPLCVRDLVRDPSSLMGARRLECSSPASGDEEACELCEDDHFSNLHFVLSRGRIYELSTTFSDDEQVTKVLSIPATPEICASVNDPCGDPSGLPIPPGASFWVANDGASALVHQGDRWLVIVRGQAAATVIHVGPRGHPIGVRHHIDARPLLDELGTRSMVTAASSMPIGSRPARASATCASDDDCLAAGMCYGFCGVDSACHEDGCDDEHECESESDTVCDFGAMQCIEPSSLRPRATDVLAREDARYARTNPRDHGAGWARRCHAHIARDRIDEAYGACVRALGANPTPVVLVAVFRDLSVIAARKGRYEEDEAFEMYARFAEEEIEEEAPPPSRPRGRRHR